MCTAVLISPKWKHFVSRKSKIMWWLLAVLAIPHEKNWAREIGKSKIFRENQPPSPHWRTLYTVQSFWKIRSHARIWNKDWFIARLLIEYHLGTLLSLSLSLKYCTCLCLLGDTASIISWLNVLPPLCVQVPSNKKNLSNKDIKDINNHLLNHALWGKLDLTWQLCMCFAAISATTFIFPSSSFLASVLRQLRRTAWRKFSWRWVKMKKCPRWLHTFVSWCILKFFVHSRKESM